MANDNKIKYSYLKSRLEDNRLDLSLSELLIVPVKEIQDLKKVTQLDLSRNRLESLPKEFCINLTNLTEIDLSSNRLRFLPDNFGNLVHLQRLDLYKNDIKDLPDSFCKLKQLKWLDLKDNPLNENLRSIAGDFSSEKECKQAAIKLVQYTQKLHSENERERQKKLTAERELEAAKKLKEEEERKLTQMDKKKQKDDKKKRQAEMVTKNVKESEVVYQKKEANSKHSSKKSENPTGKSGDKKKRSNFLWNLLKFLFYLVIWSVILTALATFVLMLNCSTASSQQSSSDSSSSSNNLAFNNFLPNSRELCHDLYHFATTGRLTLTWNYKESWRQILNNTKSVADKIGREIQQFDFDQWKIRTLTMLAELRTKMAPIFVLTRDYFEQIFTYAIHFAKIWAKVTVQALALMAEYIGHVTLQTFDWTLKNGRDVAENYPAYWQKFKFYWTNVK